MRIRWEGDAFDPECPTRIVLYRAGDKSTVLIVDVLDAGPRRCNEIRLPIGGITPIVLTSTLRSLVAVGFVSREVFAEPVPRVKYALTELGRSLQEPAAALRRWEEANVAAISENRDRRSAEEQASPGRV